MNAAGPPQGTRPLGGAAQSDARGDHTSVWARIPATRVVARTVRRRGVLARGLLLLLAACACANALAVPTCTIASGATLSFGSVVALASTGDVTTNSGSSLWVNCTSDVSTTPALYSSTTRTLVSGGRVARVFGEKWISILRLQAAD